MVQNTIKMRGSFVEPAFATAQLTYGVPQHRNKTFQPTPSRAEIKSQLKSLPFVPSVVGCKPAPPEPPKLTASNIRANSYTILDVSDYLEKKKAESKSSEHFVFTSEQQRVIDAARTGKNVMFTGGAGTGKTWLSLQLIEMMERMGKNVRCLATTGNASTLLGG